MAVGWEVLTGLPGDGPIPYHFHLGHPSPWAEGLVVRFWKADGSSWVGNFTLTIEVEKELGGARKTILLLAKDGVVL